VIEIANLIYMLLRQFPKLKALLKKAHMKQTPEEFIKRNLTNSIFISIAFTVLLFFAFDKAGISLAFLVLVFPVLFIIGFTFFMNTPRGTIQKREGEINKEVLFAGRYLLVKLESGVPLFNALIDGSRSYGVSSKYFKEIVDDINTGKPIEKALDDAREYNASEKFKVILAELVTTLKTGVDVTVPLRNILKQLATEQAIEIKEYGKKLNAYVMMYLIIGVIAPSLGMTLFVIVGSFLSLELSTVTIVVIIFFLILVQLFFIHLFKSARPMVNL